MELLEEIRHNCVAHSTVSYITVSKKKQRERCEDCISLKVVSADIVVIKSIHLVLPISVQNHL